MVGGWEVHACLSGFYFIRNRMPRSHLEVLVIMGMMWGIQEAPGKRDGKEEQ